jgi:hypothetical protein
MRRSAATSRALRGQASRCCAVTDPVPRQAAVDPVQWRRTRPRTHPTTPATSPPAAAASNLHRWTIGRGKGHRRRWHSWDVFDGQLVEVPVEAEGPGVPHWPVCAFERDFGVDLGRRRAVRIRTPGNTGHRAVTDTAVTQSLKVAECRRMFAIWRSPGGHRLPPANAVPRRQTAPTWCLAAGSVSGLPLTTRTSASSPGSISSGCRVAGIPSPAKECATMVAWPPRWPLKGEDVTGTVRAGTGVPACPGFAVPECVHDSSPVVGAGQ